MGTLFLNCTASFSFVNDDEERYTPRYFIVKGKKSYFPRGK